MTATAEAIWHDVECGSYAADLPLWEQLVEHPGARVLELGCGTGRVALHLARRGHRVTGVDRERALLDALAERAHGEGLEVRTRCADACGLDLGERFELVLGPMQLAQLLDEPGRASMLAAVARHLAPGGRAAFALTAAPASDWRPGPDASPPPPDVRELDGWVHSSQPTGIVLEGGAIVLRRRRQSVSPGGELRESAHVVRLRELAPEALEREALAAGLAPLARHEVAPTADHVGSVVVVLGARR